MPDKDRSTFSATILAALIAVIAFKLNWSVPLWSESVLIVWPVGIILGLIGLATYIYALGYIKHISGSIREGLKQAADFVYTLAILSPILLLTLWIVTEVFYIGSISFRSTVNILLPLVFSTTIQAIIAAITIIFSYRNAKTHTQIRQAKLVALLAKYENRQLEKATVLFKQRFYSESILEAFKVIDLALKRKIAQHEGYVDLKLPYQLLVQKMQEKGYISKADVARMNEIRLLRNRAAHMDIEFDEAEAKKVIDEIGKLLTKLNHSS